MRRLLLCAAVLVCGSATAGAQYSPAPYASLQQAGTAVAPQPSWSAPTDPLPAPPGEMKFQPFGPNYHDTPFLLAADAQPPSGAAPGGAPAEGGAEGGGGGDGENNGTNPAQNITTFIATNEFFRLQGGAKINTTYTRFKFPVYNKRGSVLLEVPYVFYNLTATNPNLPEVGGLGDLKIQGSFNTWTSENKRLTVINFLECFIPSADNAILSSVANPNQFIAFNLGTGKFVLGPGLGVVYALAPNAIFAPLYFYEASVAGDDSRQRIRRGKFRVFAMYALKNGLYTLPEFQAVTNYLNGNTDFYVAPEVGYAHKGTTLYVKPGFGIDPKPGDRLWGIEFGARVQF